MQESKERYTETVRRMRDEEVQTPLIGRKRTPEERRAALVGLVTAPAQLFGVMDEMTARYNLPKEKPIPKRLAEYLNRMGKEMQESAER